MKYNIPCSVIQDLLPNYIEHLTSEETDNEIKKHLNVCEDCQKVYDLMQSTGIEPVNNDDQQEIDFLKKTRKNTKRTLLLGLISAVCIFAIIIGMLFYVVGRPLEHVNCNEILLEGNHSLEIIGTCGYDEGFKKMNVVDEDGVLHVSFTGTRKDGIYHNDFVSKYISDNVITEVWIGKQIVWKDGISISPETASLYDTRHVYVGDMSENNRTAALLYMNTLLGTCEHELETSQEPYGWRIISKEDLSDQTEEYIHQTLRLYASALLAETENLSYVTFSYVMNGRDEEQSFTTEDISAYAGEDIKIIGADIIKLEQFMKNSGLIYLTSINYDFISNARVEREILLRIINDAVPVQSIGLNYFSDTIMTSTSMMMNADNSLIQVGDQYDASLRESDFGGKKLDSENISITLFVTDENGRTHNVDNVSLKELKEMDYTLHIQKDDNDNYTIS